MKSKRKKTVHPILNDVEFFDTGVNFKFETIKTSLPIGRYNVSTSSASHSFYLKNNSKYSLTDKNVTSFINRYDKYKSK